MGKKYDEFFFLGDLDVAPVVKLNYTLSRNSTIVASPCITPTCSAFNEYL